jgi:hypothetical protein
MFQLQAEANLRLRHLHDDGTWGMLTPTPTHHDPADHDPERDWARGRIYACTTCDEQVMVSLGDEDDPPVP